GSDSERCSASCHDAGPPRCLCAAAVAAATRSHVRPPPDSRREQRRGNRWWGSSPSDSVLCVSVCCSASNRACVCFYGEQAAFLCAQFVNSCQSSRTTRLVQCSCGYADFTTSLFLQLSLLCSDLRSVHIMVIGG
ncbi:unnamed protein product, partial [Ixodes pacificus]